jgi:hypothetical protein
MLREPPRYLLGPFEEYTSTQVYCEPLMVFIELCEADKQSKSMRNVTALVMLKTLASLQ